MSRWRVERGFWWVAMQVDEQGREIPGTAKRFPTHAEALAYADEEARTREYVLPRDTDSPSEHLKIDPLYRGGAAVTTVDDGARLLLKPKEIRPLALALLAHADTFAAQQIHKLLNGVTND